MSGVWVLVGGRVFQATIILQEEYERSVFVFFIFDVEKLLVLSLTSVTIFSC